MVILELKAALAAASLFYNMMQQKIWLKPRVVAHTLIPVTWTAEARGLQVKGLDNITKTKRTGV